MAGDFAVVVTARFERLAKGLAKRHPAFPDILRTALAALARDPHNRERKHSIKKLAAVAFGEGQYRLRVGRWRFRYDVDARTVVLHYAGLRREDTYRLAAIGHGRHGPASRAPRPAVGSRPDGLSRSRRGG